MERKFKIGNVARLKSGGPNMTIETYPHVVTSMANTQTFPNKAKCVWFVKEEKHSDVFDVNMLELVK